MSISVSCNCGNRFDVADDQGGKPVVCPACATQVIAPPRPGRVGLSTAKYLAEPQQELSNEEIRKIAKRRSMDPVSKQRRNYSTVKFGVGGTLMVAAAYLLFVGGEYTLYLLMGVLVVAGIAFMINGFFEYLNNKAAAAEAGED
jgi:hypothetical protein